MLRRSGSERLQAQKRERDDDDDDTRAGRGQPKRQRGATGVGFLWLVEARKHLVHQFRGPNCILPLRKFTFYIETRMHLSLVQLCISVQVGSRRLKKLRNAEARTEDRAHTVELLDGGCGVVRRRLRFV